MNKKISCDITDEAINGASIIFFLADISMRNAHVRIKLMNNYIVCVLYVLQTTNTFDTIA